MPRPTPFDLVFAAAAADVFPRIHAELEWSGADPSDRDAFLMAREVVALIRELRPEEGMGGAIDQLAALVHHGYLFWAAGSPVVPIPAERVAGLLAPSAADLPGPGTAPPAYYAQFPERRIWAEVVPGTPPEPLDGCFVDAPSSEALRVLGVFGLRPDRLGLSVVEVGGPRPRRLARPDGSPLFASTLPGGEAARLHSLTGAEELLELGWRTRGVAAGTPAEAT